MTLQVEAAELFRRLHAEPNLFVIPNASDLGTAFLLERAGFKALGTSSAGHAFLLGLPDGEVGRDATIRHVGAMVSSTSLPVSADLGNGFGASPERVAETVRLAAAAGAVGCSIEDATGDPAEPLFPLGLAKDRIIAAVEAARTLPFHFTLTARAENFLVGRPCLDDAVQRIAAYRDAGADVLYAPALPDEAALTAVMAAANGRPVNMLATASGIGSDLGTLCSLGVRRVSIGSALTRLAFTAVRDAVVELEKGRLDFLRSAMPLAAANDLFGDRAGTALPARTSSTRPGS